MTEFNDNVSILLIYGIFFLVAIGVVSSVVIALGLDD